MSNKLTGFGLLVCIGLSTGCKLKTEGYVVTQTDNGNQVVCQRYKFYSCGVTAVECEDGVERHCMTNVTVRTEEAQ